MPSVVVVGAQWGDEGKGKVIDILAAQADWVVRSQGGNNAGHTILFSGKEYKLHLTPTGILHTHTRCAITAGCVIDPDALIQEIDLLESQGIKILGRLFLSPSAHLILPYHKHIDAKQEEAKSAQAIGTTRRGIGPAYADRAERIGLRVGDLLNLEDFEQKLRSILKMKNEEGSLEETLHAARLWHERLKTIIKDTAPLIWQARRKGETILFEGAQGTFLDLTSGTYPFVTSSHTTANGILAGAEAGPGFADHILGITKAYCTRVGRGPFPTEITENSPFDAHTSREIGTTTGRLRRIGWFDACLARKAAHVNTFTALALTKLDVLDNLDEILVCTAYELNGEKLEFPPEDARLWEKLTPIYEKLPGWKSSTSQARSFDELPENAKRYVRFLEEACLAPIALVSVGPDRSETLMTTAFPAQLTRI